jgi:hypothetical protein
LYQWESVQFASDLMKEESRRNSKIICPKTAENRI